MSKPGMENTAERSPTRDTSTMTAVTDGFLAFHTEVDKVRANMLGSKGSAFSAERVQTPEHQQGEIDKHLKDPIYASVFNNKNAGGKWNSVDQRMEDIIAA